MKRLLARLKKDQRGLTLVELLAVVVILAIVGGIAFVMIGNVIENAKKDAHVSNALQLIAAAKLYEASKGKDLEGSSVTNEKDKGALYTEGLIKEIIDPWTKKVTAKIGTVTKDTNGVYTVQFEDEGGNCKINATESVLLDEGRKACNGGTTGGGGTP